MDARAVVRNFLGYTLTRLGVDHIDIYRPGRFGPAVPIEDTVGAIADLVKAGFVRAIGLSEVGVETIRRAQAVDPIRLVEALQKTTAEKHVTASQLAIVWVLAKGANIVALIGARTRAQLTESLAALDLTLGREDIARIEETVPASAVAGARYDEHQMRILDSERT